MSDKIWLDVDIINIWFKYSNTDTVSDVEYSDSNTDRSKPCKWIRWNTVGKYVFITTGSSRLVIDRIGARPQGQGEVPVQARWCGGVGYHRKAGAGEDDCAHGRVVGYGDSFSSGIIMIVVKESLTVPPSGAESLTGWCQDCKVLPPSQKESCFWLLEIVFDRSSY